MNRWKRYDRDKERARLIALLGSPSVNRPGREEADHQHANDNVIMHFSGNGVDAHGATIGPLKSAER